MNFFWRTFILGALFGAVVCDFKCFMEKEASKGGVLPMQIDISDEVLCSTFKDRIKNIEENAKSCSLNRITVKDLLAFIDSYCNEESDLKKQYRNNENCFKENTVKAAECMTLITVPDQNTKPEDAIKNLCSKFGDIFKCIAEKVGKPCGDEALQVISSLTKALSSYTTGVCLEANSSYLIKFQWNVLLALFVVLLLWYKY